MPHSIVCQASASRADTFLYRFKKGRYSAGRTCNSAPNPICDEKLTRTYSFVHICALLCVWRLVSISTIARKLISNQVCFAAIEGDALIRSPWIDLDKFNDADYEALGTAYRQALPFSHLVVDDLFAPAALRTVADEFEHMHPSSWRTFENALQSKRATLENVNLPASAQDYFNFLYSGPFLRFLSRVTGVENLIPDPSLLGGGMHEVPAGGCFEVHVDFGAHPRTGLTNRLAVITYLNEDWSAEDGGELELWMLKPPRCGAVVAPRFARTVILEQSARAAHGHPNPVREGRKRRSVIAYFYTASVRKTASDRLATTYIRHEGYSQSQKAELYLRRITPRFVVSALRAVRRAVQQKS